MGFTSKCRLLFRVSAICLFLLAMHGQALAADDAWNGTKWGMTAEAVTKAMSGKVSAMYSYMKRGDAQFTHEGEIIDIGGHQFKPYFEIKPTLTYVMLECSDSDKYAAFLKMRDLLTKKYGAPSSGPTTQRMMGGSKIEKAQWITDSSTIVLNHVMLFISGRSSETTNVLYSPRSAAGVEKL